ncbi:MAG TPA: hypothetical protein VHM70_07640 [Polyangiaceae bacterium]|jgi:hypothetical protein|nr:hypothetical protein [Polyangiaceae bacterium]
MAVIISLTADWEGYPTSTTRRFVEVRRRLDEAAGGSVPFTHFICPAYWLNGCKGVTDNLEGAIRPDDEVALHVHCRKDLLDKTGVTFKERPKLTPWSAMQGHDVALGEYPLTDIATILDYSRGLLRQELGREVSGFRCGAWMSSDDVLRALIECGFTYDCSALPPALVGGINIDPWVTSLRELWGEIRSLNQSTKNQQRIQACQKIETVTQPFTVTIDGKTLREIPNNGALSDYVDAKQMKVAYDTLKTQAGLRCLNIGCHMDNPFGDPLVEFLTALKLDFVQGGCRLMTVAKADAAYCEGSLPAAPVGSGDGSVVRAASPVSTRASVGNSAQAQLSSNIDQHPM